MHTILNIYLQSYAASKAIFIINYELYLGLQDIEKEW
jgi:hypothetical protein